MCFASKPWSRVRWVQTVMPLTPASGTSIVLSQTLISSACEAAEPLAGRPAVAGAALFGGKLRVEVDDVFVRVRGRVIVRRFVSACSTAVGGVFGGDRFVVDQVDADLVTRTGVRPARGCRRGRRCSRACARRFSC